MEDWFECHSSAAIFVYYETFVSTEIYISHGKDLFLKSCTVANLRNMFSPLRVGRRFRHSDDIVI